ncbi:homogentisate phytyltransferase 1 [Citrus sinensis]|uniref:Homogentisate phytyltransferase 1 n=1 Tax=Citrus sinensis TaxID=2711 RepID=A0ACB8LBK4_CITSI|nr:homogentisate phytyltransferase 1 [Citrus sinensis]
MKKLLRLATGVHALDIYLLTLFGSKLLSIPSHNRVIAYWEDENHASNACHFQLLSKIPSLCTTFPNDVVYKPFNKNDHFPAVTLQHGYASKSEDGDENSKNVLLKNFNALYRFIYPYACFGLLIATTSNSLLPVEKLADLTPTFFIGLLKPLVPLLLMHIYGAAVNQVADVEIDKVNKPYMPLASGEFSMETGIAITWISALTALASAIMLRSPPLVLGVIVWLFISTAYSAQLPFLRWKGNSFLAAVCVVFMCGLIPQVPFFFHVQKYVLGRPMEVTKPLMFASALMTFISVAIAFVKDLHDVEGDREHGIQTLTVILGKEKVLWLSVYMLSTAYGAAVLVGASSSFLLSKLVTIIGHITLLLFLWHRARNVDLSNNASIFSFYMFIWQLYYAESLLIHFVR